MQIKPICTAKVLYLAPFLKWEFLELGNGLFTMPRNLHGDCASVGPLCHTRVLNMHRRIRQNTHSNRTIGKRIRFVKEALRFVRFVRMVHSSVDWYDHFWSTACCMQLSHQRLRWLQEMRNGAKLDCISLQGHLMTWCCKITATKSKLILPRKLQKG